jgi:hypothetical protein
MATKFSLKQKRERRIRVIEAPGAIFHVKPMGFTEEHEFDKSFQTFDRQTGRNVINDPAAHLKAKCRRIILGWKKLPGEDGEIPYSNENMEILCENAPELMYSVLKESRAADAVEAEEEEKNS